MITEAFITFVYQPFFNILVGFYWILDKVTGGEPDMGVAVIFLTLLIRLLLLPLSLAEHRSQKEKDEIAEAVRELEEEHKDDPIQLKLQKKTFLRQNKRVIIAEFVNLTIQVTVALMLYKIFKTGLAGEDIHYIYPFMPEVKLPFNLVFWETFDLSKPNFALNLLQSFLIFVLETINIYFFSTKVTRQEVVRMQLTLPIMSFIVFMWMPAGKKIFVITSLIVSILISIFRGIRRKFLIYKLRKEHEEQARLEGKEVETVVVDVK